MQRKQKWGDCRRYRDGLMMTEVGRELEDQERGIEEAEVGSSDDVS